MDEKLKIKILFEVSQIDSYSFQLEWERMAGLVNGIEHFWAKLKENIIEFTEQN